MNIVSGNVGAWYVRPDGGLVSGYIDSYGSSPYTSWINFTCLVYSDGTIGYGSGNFIVSFSYGSPGTDWNDCCYYVKSFGILFPRYGNSVEDDPDNSYGK